MSGAASLPKLKLSVRLGASSDIALRIETSDLRFVAITGMAKTAPMRVTAPSHGIPDLWQVSVIDSRGMTEMNADDANKLRDADFNEVTVIDANTVDFTRVSSASFKTYTGGGYLVYYVPLDLSGYTAARMDIKRRVGGDVELALSTAAGTLEIDAAAYTLWIRLDESDIAALSAREYVFDIELVSPTAIDAVCSADSVFEVLPEVTTSV